MACKYFVKGEWLEKEDFKKVLNNGLLDQLVANQDFVIPGFTPNQKFLKTQGAVKMGPVKISVVKKTTGKINTFLKISEARKGQPVGYTNVKNPRRNPKKVIDESNDQIKAENKRLNTNRSLNKLILVTKIKGELKYGNAPKATVAEINDPKSGVDIKSRLQEGKVYMLVPSSHGLTPIWLRSSMLGEVNQKIVNEVKANLATIFKSTDKAAIKLAKKNVEKYLYQVAFTRTGDEVKVVIKKYDEETGKMVTSEKQTFDNINDLTTFVIGKYDKKGNYIGEINDQDKRTQAGRIARTNHFAFNDSKNSLSNEFYANNGFITTNVFSEGGNFFNSTSFIIEAFEASAKSKEALAAVLNNPDLNNTPQEIEEIEENTAAKKVSTPIVKDQKTKKDESPIYNMPPKKVKRSIDAELKVPSKIATYYVEMGEVMEPNRNTKRQAVIHAKIKDGALIVDSIDKREGVKEKGKREVWSVANKPFSTKQRNKLIKDFFNDPKVIAFKEKLANQKAPVAIKTEQEESVTEEAQSIIDSLLAPQPTEAESKWVLTKNEPSATKLEPSDAEFEIFENRQHDLELNDQEWNRRAMSAAEDGGNIHNPESQEEADEWAALGTPYQRSIDAINKKYDDQLAALNPNEKSTSSELEDKMARFHKPGTGEDLDLSDTPFRITVKKEDATNWSKEKEEEWLQKKISNHLVEGPDNRLGKFKTIEDLQAYLPKQTYELLLEARKNGKVLHGVFTKAAVLLNENAYSGTAYHEAFHVVFNLALPLESRLDLLEEALELFPNEIKIKVIEREGDIENPTYLDIEEVLADKFMEYVQTVEAIAPSLGTKIKNFFKALFRGIKLLFNSKSRVTVQDLFSDIQLGVYKNKPNFKNTDLTKIDPEMVKFMMSNSSINAHTEIDPRVELQAIRYMEAKFLNVLDTVKKDAQTKVAGTDYLSKYHGKTDSEIIADVKVGNLYNLMLSQIINDAMDLKGKPGVTNLHQLIALITDNFNDEVVGERKVGEDLIPVLLDTTPIMEKFNRSLRKFNWNINLNSLKELRRDNTEEISLSEEVEEDTIIEGWQQVTIEINPRDTISQQIKRMFGTIPKMKLVDGRKVPSKNMFGATNVYTEREVFSYVGKNITDSRSPTDMIEKLKALRTEKDFINPILIEIEKNPSFKTALWTTLASKTFQRFITIYEKDGEYETFYSNRKGVDDIIKENLIGDFLAEGSPMFGKHPHTKAFIGGQSNFEDIKFDVAESQFSRVEEILKKAKVAKEDNVRVPIIKELSKFLIDNNINVTVNQLLEIWNPQATDKNEAGWINVVKVIKGAKSIFNELINSRNPFLDLKPSEQLANGTKNKSNGSIISNFAGKLKPALNDEISLSFRGANKKTAYSIQYSNYLSKLITEYKSIDTLNEHLDRLAGDPLLRNMPFFTDLRNSDGSATKLMDELQIAIFDGLARRGKSTAVEYTKLSDIEIEAASMGAFHNQGNRTYGFYRMPIPSDSGTAPFIKYKKFTNDEVIDRLVQVGIAETERINSLKSSPTDSKLRRISNYFRKGKKYQILSFLNGKIDSSALNQDELREIIKEHLEGEFLELHKRTHLKAGVITKFSPGVNGKITFADKVITTSQKAKATEFYKNYIYNQYYVNTQTTTIFAGDPSFYGGTVNYQKRYKQVISPGTLTDSDAAMPEYNSIILADEVLPSSKELINDAIQLINESNLSATKKKELITLWKAKGEEAENKDQWNNHTDGFTMIGIDRMMNILDSLGRVTAAHEKAAVRIANGTETIADAALFTVLKPFMFTKQIVNGVEVPIQIKNSEMLLTKAFAYRKDENGNYKYPKLIEAHRILTEGIEKNGEMHAVDSIMFESAVKVGGIGNELSTDGEATYSNLERNADGTYSLDSIPEIITLQHRDWRLQQETPNHSIDEDGNFGTQLRNLIISNMNPNGDYVINGKTYKGSQVIELYQTIMEDNLKTSFEEVESMFLDVDGEINYGKLIEHLKREMERTGLDQDYFDAIAPVVNPDTGKIEPTLPLWHPLIAYKTESLINSFFKNGVTKQKIRGGNIVNASSYGLDSELKMTLGKNGMYTVEAMLPWWSKKYFPKNEQGNVDISNLPEELKNILGYRIPTEDKYSMFNIKVKGFTDSAAGGAIMLPIEITWLSGLDFDIDKLFLVVPEFRKNNEGKIEYIKYIDETTPKSKIAELLIDSSQSYEQFVEQFIPEADRDKWRLKKELADDDLLQDIKAKQEFSEESELFQMEKERKDLYIQRSLNTNPSARSAITREISKLGDKINEFKTYQSAIDGVFAQIGIANKPLVKLQEEVTAVLEAQSNKNMDYESLNNTKSRNNRLLEIMTGIMSNKHTAMSVLEPGNFERLKEIGTKTRIQSITADSTKVMLKIKKDGLALINQYKKDEISVLEYQKKLREFANKLDDQDFNINYPSTQLTLFRRNMTGRALIGIFANHNTHHAKAQHTSLSTAKDIYFDGEAYSMLNQTVVNGQRVSTSISSKLAAVVDNASDPVSAYLNMNTFTADLIALMSRLGINEDTIFAFINQPILIELVTKHFNEKGSLAEQEGMVSEIKRKWKSKMASKAGITSEELTDLQNFSGEQLNFNLEELEKSLDANGTKEYYLTQYKVLLAFDQYFRVAQELSAGVQASRVDSKPVGPTYGDNYAMVNRQAKLLSKNEPEILGIEQMLYKSSNQIVNPAFNKYAWIKPISIMNKIFPSIGKIDEATGNIEYSTLGRIKNFFSELKSQSYSISPKEARDIDTHFMTYLASAMPFFKYKNAQSILNNTPNELSKYKLEHPDSPFSPLLDQLYTRSADKQVKVRRIEFYNTGKEELDIETARQVWKIMLKSEDPATKKLALNLVKYAYFSNGYAFGPFSFFNLIPTYFWTDSFATDINNSDVGMLDSKGRTFNQMLKAALVDIGKTKKEESLIKSEILNRFVMQFAQNTAEKSMIIKTVESKDASDRKYAPHNVPRELAKNEVYVFPSTNLGTHNTSLAGYAFSKDRNYNPAVGIKGTVGEWAEYGVTGQQMQGTSGKGFAVRAQEVEIENGEVSIKKIGELTEDEQTAQIKKLISDLEKLAILAEANSDLTYIVSNLSMGTGWSKWAIKKALIKVMENYDLPNNILLPKVLEVRDFGSIEVKENQIMTLHKPSIMKHNRDILIGDNEFPSFLKTSHKGNVKLFKLVSGSDTITKDGQVEESSIIHYRRIPLLGTSNFVSEYDFSKDITESIVPNLTKEIVKAPLPNLNEAPMTQFEVDQKTQGKTAYSAESSSKWVIDPKDVGDFAKLVPSKKKPVLKKIEFEEFSKLAASKGLTLDATKEEWDAASIEEQNVALEQLKTC